MKFGDEVDGSYFERKAMSDAALHRPTGHPGSKRGHVHRPGEKGNVWRATTRPLRRYPGWKKRLIKIYNQGGFRA